MSAKQTHVCDFGAGLSCTMVVNPTRLVQGKTHIQRAAWSRKPTKEEYLNLFPRYRDWMHGINQACAERTRATVLYIFQPTLETFQVWSYVPGRAPQMRLPEPKN
jgi:hypothetical protein